MMPDNSCKVCGRTLKNPKYVAMGIGPVCARKAGINVSGAHTKAGNTRSDWRHEWVDGILVIYDLNLGGMSVTNDMENVLKCIGAKPTDTILYQDSELYFDQVSLTESGSIIFFPIRSKVLSEALLQIRKIKCIQ